MSVRAEVPQGDDRADPEHADRAEQGVADQRPAADAGLLDAEVEVGEDLRLVLVAGGGRVAVLDDLVVAHQLAGPLDGADPDAQQRQAEGDAQRHVRGAELAERARVLTDAEGEVRGDEQDHEDRGEPEQAGDLALGTPLGGLVDVGRARLVLGHARVREGLDLGLDRGQLVVVAHDVAPFFLLVRAVEEAIHTAATTSEPMPASQANRPSETGPSDPMVNPPYAGVCSFFFR